jgi:hypothetical protein
MRSGGRRLAERGCVALRQLGGVRRPSEGADKYDASARDRCHVTPVPEEHMHMRDAMPRTTGRRAWTLAGSGFAKNDRAARTARIAGTTPQPSRVQQRRAVVPGHASPACRRRCAPRHHRSFLAKQLTSSYGGSMDYLGDSELHMGSFRGVN